MRTTVSSTIAISLLALSLASCKSATGGAGLRGTVPAEDVRGYSYSRIENDDRSAESLTNPAAIDPTPQPQGTTSVVIGYKQVVDKKAQTTTTYKSEARRSGNEVTLVVTDLATNQAVLDTRFPPVVPHPEGGPVFVSLNACISDFLCKNGSALQCEANRTCRDQLWGLICCLRSGGCVSVHGVVRPNTLRCQVIGPIADFEAVVFAQ